MYQQRILAVQLLYESMTWLNDKTCEKKKKNEREGNKCNGTREKTEMLSSDRETPKGSMWMKIRHDGSLRKFFQILTLTDMAPASIP
ncbi:hypothetical protein PsorP6_000563 [Peronosclerospora sorghi]|uniref:Uncharacterized protein n=1 Tax=Peronosclerospora sorghi TaxID=230839 RepID=A0ACC0WX63_9STRA|nr:hypothetical protein PsorP6_000563 [Peronosclerospora sorghi]